MSEETMKLFLEYVVRSLEVMQDGVKFLLQNYQTAVYEQNHPLADAVSVEQVRSLLLSKVQEGKAEEIKELFNLFQVEKLSDLNEQYYQELFQMAKDI